MTTFLLIVIVLLGIAVAVINFLRQRAEAKSTEALQARDQAIAATQRIYQERVEELDAEEARIREHYDAEARKLHDDWSRHLAQISAELESLKVYGDLKDAEAEVREKLSKAIAEASTLQSEARMLVEQTKVANAEERAMAQLQAEHIRKQADVLLAQISREAARIISEAEQRAVEIGGHAYEALREKEMLEQAVTAIRNIIDGYGDRYIVPTHSLLDDLAEEFGHTTAGEALKLARAQSSRMASGGQAAACDYAESNRRETAIRFVVDAFNGRVDAVLSTVRHNNHGSLEQSIRDIFSLVNLNGQAFRNARILPAYLDARLAELKWAVVAQELKDKEREEQRQIKEKMREEERARREIERAIQEAAREEATIKQAMEKARAAAAQANAEERAKFEAQLAELGQRLSAAEAKNQRALSMAQQTRAGHVYVISNVGSFGEDVFKIGMTRRLEPLDRVKELGDASVPFEFDVHAMIYSQDAPALERQMHKNFDDLRINKVNYRKEFFRVPLARIRSFTDEQRLDATFTMVAEAREYRETTALEKMPPAEREKYQLHETAEDQEAE